MKGILMVGVKSLMKIFVVLPVRLIRAIYTSQSLAYLKYQFGRIGERTRLSGAIRVSCPRHVFIGNNVSIGSQVVLWASSKGRIVIGDGCAISSGVRIVTPTHDPKFLPITRVGINKSITIGEDVWIGTAAIILPGVTVNDGAVVGADVDKTLSIEDCVKLQTKNK